MNNSFNYLPKQKDSCKIKEITNQNQLRNKKKDSTNYKTKKVQHPKISKRFIF